MNKYGITIRRKELFSKSRLDQHIKKIHKRIKNSGSKTITYYTHEMDRINTKYHSHLFIYTEADKDVIKPILERFIGCDKWIRNYKSYHGEDTYGKYGEIHLHEMYDYDDEDDGVSYYNYVNYLDKKNTARILV